MADRRSSAVEKKEAAREKAFMLPNSLVHSAQGGALCPEAVSSRSKMAADDCLPPFLQQSSLLLLWRCRRLLMDGRSRRAFEDRAAASVLADKDKKRD